MEGKVLKKNIIEKKEQGDSKEEKPNGMRGRE